MAASTLRAPAEAEAQELSARSDPDEPTQRRLRRLQLTIGLAVATACTIALLVPVVGAPVHADDRYWYLMIGPRADGSVLDLVRWTWDAIPDEAQLGRLATLGLFERRLAGMAVVEASVATATPFVVYLALVKLVLVVGAVLTGVAFVRSLRWHGAEGVLVRAGRRTLMLVGVAAALTTAVGAQAQSQFRNGWTSYAVLTYGAAICIFGSVALLLWLTRLVVNGSRAVVVSAVVVLLLLATALNLSYELVYPAIPVAAVALAIVPVADRAQRSAERRAKLVTGSAYFGGFIVVFIAIRLYLADICSRTDCYDGVELQLGSGTVRTSFYNLVTAVPGAGGNELLADLKRVGWADRYPVPPNVWSITVGLAAAGAVLLLWWTTRRHESPAAVPRGGSSIANTNRRAEVMLLSVGAGLSALVALGTATVMGLSAQSQEIITEPGTPYRNTMVTWTALAFSLVLAVAALGHILRRSRQVLAWGALAALIGIVGAVTLPGNLMALRAYRVHPDLALTEAINWEVALGDTTTVSEARRCTLFARLVDSMPNEWTRSKIYKEANLAFDHYHGQAFCSDPRYSGSATS